MTTQDKMREAIAKVIPSTEQEATLAAARCAEIAEEAKWIRVEDGLPENRTQVLAICENGYMEVSEYKHSVFYDPNGLDTLTPTHWQNLPPTPQKPKQ